MKPAIRGLPRAELLRIWEDVQANHKRLEACAGPHDFQPVIDPKLKLPRDYTCALCNGRISATDHFWYARGIAHGSRPQ